MTRLRWHHLARAARTVLACAALATCSPDATAPGGRVESVLDLAALLRAPGDLPIAIDEVVVELRRTSDSSLAGAPQTIGINPANQSDTALRVTVQVEMSRDQEDFYLKVEARGNAVLYFVVESIVTARKNRRTETAALTPVYVGPGAQADDLEVSLIDEDIVAGDSVLVTGAAFENEVEVPGTPIGFVSSQPTVVLVRRVAINQVWLIASPTAPDASVPVTVSGPNGLSEEFFVNVIGDTPTGLHFVAVSAAAQNGVVNQLVASVPRVRLLDENNAAVPNAAVTFVTTGSGGTITDSVLSTDTEGEAAVGTWRLGTLAGAYTVNATATGVTALPFTAQAGPTALASLVRISGDSQTAATNTALGQPLVIEARDTFANPLAAGPTVTWTATDGAITPSTQLNAQGRTQASWTLGGSQAVPTATATLNGVTTIFSATTTFPNPTIQLSFTGTPGVGIGRTSRVRVALTAAAPAGGVVVNLSSDQAGIATVPTSVTITAGQTADSVLVTGVAAGAALITGSASGYISGTLTVDVQLRNLNLPVTINVPYGQTASLPITIPSPAPAGGITIAVVSSNPSLVGVTTPTVTIAAGGTTTSATLQGVLPGTADVSVSHAAYAPDTVAATSLASLNFAQTSVGINASFGSPIDVDFISNAIAIPAPAPGVTLTSTVSGAQPTCVAVTPSPATIATGLTSTTLNLSYTGTVPAPCSSKVVVTAPNIQPDSITVSVAAVPVITIGNITVGTGLMDNLSVNLGASNHGGTTVSVVSLNPAIALAAPNATTSAADSIGIPIAAGVGNTTIYLHGVTPGVATFVARAAGFVTDTFTITVVQAALDLNSLPTTTTTFSANRPFVVRVGLPNAGNTALSTTQLVRFGVPALDATVTTGTPATGLLVTATESGASSVIVPIAPGQANSPSNLAGGGVEFDPLVGGTTAVSATIPGLITLPTATVTVTVSAPTITANGTTVAANLMSQQIFGALSAGNHGGIDITLKSSNPAVMLVSPNAVTPGTDSIMIHLLNGGTSFTYYVQGTGGQTGTADLLGSAPGFTPSSSVVTVPQASYDISGLVTSITNLAPNDGFTVRVGYGTTGALQAVQEVRPGGTPIVATISNSNTAVADLVTTALTGDVVTATIPVGLATTPSVAAGGVEFDPVAGGTTTVSASIPGLLATANASGNVTITATPLSINGGTVGSGLMTSLNGSVGGSSQHGGVTLVIKSLNPAVAQIASLTTTAAADSVVYNLPNGTNNFNYTIHGMDGVNDSTLIVAYATGFTPDTALVRVPQAALDVSSVPTNATTSSVNDNFTVRVGLPNAGNGFLGTTQARRFGAPTLVATVTNSNAPIADLITTSTTGDLVTVTIPAGSAGSSTVAAGGVDIDFIAAGTTTIAATIPGYIATTTASQAVTIAAPGISLSGGILGAGLMVNSTGNLGSAVHPTDTLVLTSSQPSVLLLSPNATTPGTASIKIAVASGQSSFSYVLHGVEAQTGTVAIQAQFPGFTDGNTTGEVRPAAIDIAGLNSPLTAFSADEQFQVRIGYANAGNTAVQVSQARRAGAATLVVTLSSSNVAIGRLKSSTDTGATVTAQILAGQSATPSSVASGGVSFDPLTVGGTNVTATAPGMVATAGATVAMTVTAPTISTNAQTVGGGLQTLVLTGSLNAPVPAGGLNVTITSANPSVVLLAPNATTAGVGQIVIPLAAGATNFGYVVSAPFGVTGTANVTAAIPGYTGDTKLVTVVQPAFEMSSLTATQTVAAANDEFVLRIGIPNALNTSIQSFQQVRFGGAELVATINNSNATAAQLVTQAGTGQSRTVPVFIGANTTPTTVAAGGVSFDGLAPGTTTVSATIPGFIVLPSSSVNVTVNP